MKLVNQQGFPFSGEVTVEDKYGPHIYYIISIGLDYINGPVYWVLLYVQFLGLNLIIYISLQGIFLFINRHLLIWIQHVYPLRNHYCQGFIN